MIRWEKASAFSFIWALLCVLQLSSFSQWFFPDKARPIWLRLFVALLARNKRGVVCSIGFDHKGV